MLLQQSPERGWDSVPLTWVSSWTGSVPANHCCAGNLEINGEGATSASASPHLQVMIIPHSVGLPLPLKPALLPKSSSPPFSSFFPKENKGEEWPLWLQEVVLPAQQSGWNARGPCWGALWDQVGKCTGTRLESVPGSGWEVRCYWAGAHQYWARKHARIRVGSTPALGWEAQGERAGNHAWIEVRSMPASGWEAHWHWAGKHVRTGQGSTLGLG